MGEYGTNLVTNGTFTTDMTGWTVGPASSWSVSGGKAVLTGDESGDFSQTISITAGKTYFVSFSFTRVLTQNVNIILGGTYWTKTLVSGTNSDTMVAGSSGSLIKISAVSIDGETLTIDNLEVKELSNVGSLWEQALMETVLGDTAVAAYLGDNMFNNYAPPTVTYPYVIYEQISGPRDQTFDGPSGLATIRVQINAFATTYLESRTVADVIRRKLDGFEGTVSLTGGGSCKILETKLIDEGDVPSERPDNTVVYGKRQDYEMVIDERP